MQSFRYSRSAHVILAMILALARATAAESFRMLPRSEKIPERGEVPGFVIVTETNRFSFLAPLNWKVTDNATQRTVTFIPRTLNARITCRVLTGKDAPDPAALPAEIARRFPEAKILEEFKCYTRSAPGMAFDLERRAASTRLSTRIAFVAFPGGILEFELSTSARQLAEFHLTFANLLNSFAIEPMSP